MSGSVGVAAGAAIALAIGQLVIAIGLYVWIALALSAVFRKAREVPWKAWVPVWNAWTLFELGGMRGWWSVVILGGGIVAAGGSAGLGLVLVTAANTAQFEGDVAGAQATALAAVALPLLLWLALAALAVILVIRMLIGVNRGFGLGTGMIVLGVLVFPVWASIVGWGSARWIVAAEAPADAVPEAPPAPIVPALADFSPTPAAVPPAAPAAPAAFAPGAPAAPAAPVAPSAPVAPVTPSAAVAPTPAAAPVARPGNPWAPPGNAFPTPPAAAAAAPARTPAPAAPAPAAPAPATPAPAAAVDDLDERTVLAGRRGTSWSLQLPGGGQILLTGATAVIGRNPVPPVHAPGAQVVAVDDVTRTVSKTHALLTRNDQQWYVTDLASTNGVFVGPTPDAGEVSGTAPVDGSFFLGDAHLVLRAV